MTRRLLLFATFAAGVALVAVAALYVVTQERGWNALVDLSNYQRNVSIGEVEVEMDWPFGGAIYH